MKKKGNGFWAVSFFLFFLFLQFFIFCFSDFVFFVFCFYWFFRWFWYSGFEFLIFWKKGNRSHILFMNLLILKKSKSFNKLLWIPVCEWHDSRKSKRWRKQELRKWKSKGDWNKSKKYWNHKNGKIFFSIISVMLLAIIPIILNYTNISNRIVFFLLGISLLFLIMSLLFSIAAQWRYDYLGLNNIDSIYHLMDEVPLKEVNMWWLTNLNDIYNSKNNLNERRVKFMRYSTFFFGISILTILIYSIALLIYIWYD